MLVFFPIEWRTVRRRSVTYVDMRLCSFGSVHHSMGKNPAHQVDGRIKVINQYIGEEK